jgi:hypothetical protein
MKRINFYKTGLSLGLVPICGLGLLLLIFWIGRAWFAADIDVTGIGFLYILISVPIVLIGFILTAISLSVGKGIDLYKILWFILILFNIPILVWILKTHGEISGRAYLKIINNSGKNIRNVSVNEPDTFEAFGDLKKDSDKIIFYHPDYASSLGIQYAGISQNYLVLEIEGDTIRKQIPIIHPGEIHQLTIDKDFSLSDIYLNKLVLTR